MQIFQPDEVVERQNDTEAHTVVSQPSLEGVFTTYAHNNALPPPSGERNHNNINYSNNNNNNDNDNDNDNNDDEDDNNNYCCIILKIIKRFISFS
jgi:hypothetical protein